MDLDINKNRICVFQGTFNPIHIAHIKVAEYVLHKYNFDKIIFIPAYNPPHKVMEENLAQHRFKMVELATRYNPRFVVSDIEYKRGGKSYTYLTICELQKIYNTSEKINFIIGTDAFSKIESWFEVEKLKKIVKFILFIREDNYFEGKYDYLKDKGFEFELQDLPFENISSSEFRNNKTENCVSKEVMEYIKENGLFKIYRK